MLCLAKLGQPVESFTNEFHPVAWPVWLVSTEGHPKGDTVRIDCTDLALNVSARPPKQSGNQLSDQRLFFLHLSSRRLFLSIWVRLKQNSLNLT